MNKLNLNFIELMKSDECGRYFIIHSNRQSIFCKMTYCMFFHKWNYISRSVFGWQSHKLSSVENWLKKILRQVMFEIWVNLQSSIRFYFANHFTLICISQHMHSLRVKRLYKFIYSVVHACRSRYSFRLPYLVVLLSWFHGSCVSQRPTKNQTLKLKQSKSA